VHDCIDKRLFARLRPLLLLAVAFLCVTVFAHADDTPGLAGVGKADEAGIDEQLGGYVALDQVFVNEKGDSTRLGDLIDRPTIVSLVYYTCPSVCRPLLAELTKMLGKLQQMDMRPGQDFRVVTISFDENDKPEDSARLKKEYYEQLPDGFPASAWTYLTGDSTSIARVTDSVGFHFQRKGDMFAHPTTLVILSPQGKITRYMYGSEYLPADLKMALVEAQKGIAGPTIARFLKFCFSYDPKGRKLVVNITRIVGLSTLLGIATVALFLTISGKRRKEKVV
jgi:protein SCO1/2